MPMARFRIFKTAEFDRDFTKLDKSEQSRIEKVLWQLSERGIEVGKPLVLPFFKEKKFDGKRVYFLVYKSYNVILVIAISDKKAQQATINAILLRIAEYQRYVFEELRRRELI